MKKNIYVCGVGMIPFTKPGLSMSYPIMGEEACKLALKDANLSYDKIDQVYCGYVYGESTCGQASVYNLGMTGIPIFNVNNNCSSGSSALFLARQSILSGSSECCLAFGFEQMNKGALKEIYPDKVNPLQRFEQIFKNSERADDNISLAIKLFGKAGEEYQNTYGTSNDTFAKITVKSRKHARHNPYAILRDDTTTEEVLSSDHIFGNLTKLQCCPPSCGAAAVILASDEYVDKYSLNNDVILLDQVMKSDNKSTFENNSFISLIGYEMSKESSDELYENCSIGPEDIDLAEVHDCFTINEIISYEALSFVEKGESEKFILDDKNTFGGKIVVNPSGGLLSKGHPLGATGIAQCIEIVLQLRGTAGKRQVENARLALQHNIGLGGSCVTSIYQKN